MDITERLTEQMGGHIPFGWLACRPQSQPSKVNAILTKEIRQALEGLKNEFWSGGE